MKTLLSLILCLVSLSAFAQEAKPYEILIRLNPDGSVKGAHQTKLITATLPNGSTVSKETNPEPIKVADLPKALSPALAQLSQSIADRDAALAAKSEAEKATADLQAKQAALVAKAKPAVANWDVSALRAVLIEAQTPELEKQKAALDAQIKTLTEQKAKLDSQ